MRRDVTLGLCLAAAAAAMLAFPAATAAQTSAAQRVQITDPARLRSMGFAPGSNVYELIPAADPAAPMPVEGGTSRPNYFGPSASGFSAVTARAFSGRTSSFAYSSNGFEEIFNTNPATENFADAQVEIPNGAVIEFTRIWYDDTNGTENMTVFLIESCVPLFGGALPISTVLSTIASTGSGGDGSTSENLGSTIIANSDECTYRFRVRFGNGDLTGPGNSTLQFLKARVQWLRQVSAAPGAATFTDVPTGHPFFRFVEALVSSGITGGCGGGNYCPDSPVTRGQMAVFLATALGLNFGF